MNPRFFLAEDIRIERNGRAFLIGLYPDDDIRVRTTEAQVKSGNVRLRVGFLICYFDLTTGPHEIRINIERPDGTRDRDEPVKIDVDVSADVVTTSVVVNIPGLKCATEGIYKLWAQDGKRETSFPFNVKFVTPKLKKKVVKGKKPPSRSTKST